MTCMKMNFLVRVFIAIAACLFSVVRSDVGLQLNEMELVSDLSIGDKSYAYFNLTITSNEYTVPEAED